MNQTGTATRQAAVRGTPRRPGPEVTPLPPGSAASNPCRPDTPTGDAGRVPVRRSALLSPDGRYRYLLVRSWAVTPTATMTLVGLNPSTADAGTDDATTRRVIGFARAAGCDQVTITNVSAWRSTSPNVLRHAPDPVGPDNDDWIRRAVDGADLVVAAWGTHADPERADAVLELLRHHTVWCLGTTRDGHPRHPLYVPNRTPLQIYAHPRHSWGPWQSLDSVSYFQTGVTSEPVQRFCVCGADEISYPTEPGSARGSLS